MMAVHMLHPLEELGVQTNVVSMLCQDGLQFLCKGVHIVVSFGREQVEEHRADALQQVEVALGVILLVHDGIVEVGLSRVVDDAVYLLVVTTDALHKGILEILQAYAVEGRRVVRGIVGFEQRVLPRGVVLCAHNHSLIGGAKVSKKCDIMLNY